MKNIFFFFFFLLLIVVNGQENELTELESTKNYLLQNITELKDSIKIIDKRIVFIKTQEFKKTISDSSVIGITKKGGTLKKEPSPISKIVLKLKEGQKLTLLDYYSNGYLEACVVSSYPKCGYVNSMWIIKDDKINNFIILKKAEKITLEKNKKNKRFAELEKRFGKKTANKILTKTYWIGMTNDMAVLSVGKPKHINTSVGTWGVHEQWVYENYNLYFENGKLTSYQN